MIISLPRYRIGQRVMMMTIGQELSGTILDFKAGCDSETETFYDILADNGACILAAEGLVEPAHETHTYNTEPPEAA